MPAFLSTSHHLIENSLLLNKILRNIFNSVFVHHDLKTGDLNPGSYGGKKKKMKEKRLKEEEREEKDYAIHIYFNGIFFFSFC